MQRAGSGEEKDPPEPGPFTPTAGGQRRRAPYRWPFGIATIIRTMHSSLSILNSALSLVVTF
jgi:hypothetical protein